MKKFVSVIIPTLNRNLLLQKALDSVLGQTYPYFEIIVVDDGSDDGTAQTLSRYTADYGDKVVPLFQHNQGAAAARNTGVRKARYDLIAFLDSDDRFAATKLEIQVAAMTANDSFLVSHTDEIWYRRGILLNQKKRHQRSGGDIFARCLELCAVGMSTVMLKRELFDLVGYIDEDFPCCEDFDYWLRVSVEHPFLLVAQPLTLKDGGRKDQLSFIHRIGIDRYRIKSIEKLLASGVLNTEQRNLAFTELVRKCRIYGAGCIKHGRSEEGETYLQLARNAEERRSS